MSSLVTVKKLSFIKYFLLSVFLFFVFTSFAHAQTDALRVTVLPQNPGPLENVSITVEDFSRDLNKVNISWSVGNKVVEQGVGLKRFELSTGVLGTVTTVSINMGGVTRKVTLRPAAVDLMWQADTFTPPFYKGKALHSSQDLIVAVAEPFFVDSKGVRLDPSKLIYEWKRDKTINAALSGYGKKTFRITPSILPKPIEIEVEVSSSDNTYRATASVTIPNTTPEILFYENKPLYGIDFAHALNEKDFEIKESEARIIAMPLFFSNQQNNFGLLSYDWTLNGNRVNEQGSEVILRKPENGSSGQSSINLAIKNLERFMQVANAGFTAKFSNEASTQNSQTIF